MPGYMSGTKKARSTPSITNNANIFGQCAGIPSTAGKPAWLSNYIKTRTLQNDPTQQMKPAQAREYLLSRGLLSKRPNAGGVGRRAPNFLNSGLRW